MAHFIIQGRYSTEAMKGMLARPSDREAAVRGLIEASGGRMVTFLVTTGDWDFLMIAESDMSEGLLAGLIVTGASGAVSGLKTSLAFTSAEFLEAQKKAQTIASSYRPPS